MSSRSGEASCELLYSTLQTISGLFKRYVIPFVVARANQVGKKILRNVGKDRNGGRRRRFSSKSAKEAVKERGLAGIERRFRDIMRQSPSVNDGVNIADEPERTKHTASNNKKRKKSS